MEIEIETSTFPKQPIHPNQIPKLDTNLTYNEFFQNYLRINQPCIIKNITENWDATKYWVKDHQINFSYLEQKYGNSEVIIYNCGEKYFNSQKTQCKKFIEYLKYWKFRTENNDEFLLYLKDWHLKNEYKTDEFYTVPKYFSSDWLNEYLCENDLDDYRFVYMGPRGTWTPFHSDVFSSYSWSANIYGQKKWLLFCKGAEEGLRDKHGNLPYDLSEIMIQNLQSEVQTLQAEVKVPYIEVIQEPGDAIFIPSGWHHQVWNLTGSISINHNWINGCNIMNMFEALEKNLTAVKKEIEDCKDMENFNEQCQVVLRASFGIDYKNFYEFLKYIAFKRMSMDNECNLGKNHLIFDLKSLLSVLEIFVEREDVVLLEKLHEELEYDDIIRKIMSALDKID